MTRTERVLLAHLHRYCRGADHARTYARLRRDLAALGLTVGEREMYDLVSDLVTERGRPVGTCDRGAFVVVTARDARIAYRYLYGRVCRQWRRCRRFKQVVREGLNRQEYLGLADHFAGPGKMIAEPMPTDARRQGLLITGVDG